MKKTSKILAILFAFIICVPVVLFAACKKPQASFADVVKQSISEMETIVYGEEEAQNTASFVSLSLPNQNVDMTDELQSIMRGSGVSMYFADYMFNKDLSISSDTIYKDIVSYASTDFQIYFVANEIDGGISTTFMMTSEGNANYVPNIIRTFYIYDYENNKPLQTIIINQNQVAVMLAMFDYTTNSAYTYELMVSATEQETFNSLLTSKSLNFDALQNLTVSRYKFVKINEAVKTGYYYISGSGDNGVEANIEDIAQLYDEIYGKVKDYVVPSENLDTTTTTALEYYQKMYLYASLKSKVFASGEQIIDSFIEYSDMKSILSQINTKLDALSGTDVTEVKAKVNSSITYLNSITEKEYVGSLSADASMVLDAKNLQNTTNMEYILEDATGTQYLRVIISGSTVESVELI